MILDRAVLAMEPASFLEGGPAAEGPQQQQARQDHGGAPSCSLS
jgi:hypothetical protein